MQYTFTKNSFALSSKQRLHLSLVGIPVSFSVAAAVTTALPFNLILSFSTQSCTEFPG